VSKLRLVQEGEQSLQIWYGDQRLARYVYRPTDAQLESPRPYWHPLYTLGGDLVSLYRPHDHVWHKGIAWSLPNVGTENFWGGPTYVRGRGYVQLDNDGATVHQEFTRLTADAEHVGVEERLAWVTQAGDTWFDELRRFTVTVDAGAWTLGFATRFTNVSGAEVVIGSPTTQGRDNAGYGGLFWRGPRSFTGGTVYAPGALSGAEAQARGVGGSGGDGLGVVTGADELMGIRARWLGFTGRHDETRRSSTLVFVDAPDNPGHPTQWFVRSEMFACVCPAPFFSTERPVAHGETVSLRYAVVIADGDPGLDGAAKLAKAGQAALGTALSGADATLSQTGRYGKGSAEATDLALEET
jgi:methane monooxygenase PmoA-like